MTLPEPQNAERLEAIAARVAPFRGHEQMAPQATLDTLWLLAQNTELRDALANEQDFAEFPLRAASVPSMKKDALLRSIGRQARAVLDTWGK